MGKKINNKGIAVIFLAISMIVLIGFVGLAVDIGYMYVAKGQLQNAADAAALAGAAKLDGTTSTVQAAAQAEAIAFAGKNVAAGAPVVVATDGSTNSNILSDPTNSGGNDITVGNWDPSQPQPYLTTRTPINAIQVRARRTAVGAPPENQGQVQIFFGKIFALLPGGGAGWPFMSASAQAIATIVPAPLLPIMVNEYWTSKGYAYPNSFVRKTNVNGTTSTTFGLIFPLMGSNADDNKGANNVNGFVDLDSRSTVHDGSVKTWFQVNTSLTPPATCSNCSSLFTTTTPLDFSSMNTGTVTSTKFGVALSYLLNGYKLLPPATVAEPVRSPTSIYANDNGLNLYAGITDACPYSTVALFSNSGTQPLNTALNAAKQQFTDLYPAGKKIVVLVYDGTFYNSTSAPQPNAITNVGYTLLQIDGYANNNPNPNVAVKGNKPALDASGNTVYGHAITDIVTPGSCSSSLFNEIQQLQFQGGTPVLVK